MIVTLPDRQLLEALTSHTPADRLGVELRIWDWNSPIRDVLGDEADDVVATVLPYFRPAPEWRSLADLPKLRLLQAQSAGYDNLLHITPDGVALANAVRNDVDALETYSGSTTGLERSRIVDAFQAGRVAVLLASKAAYASITLTAGSDMLFVEQFWNPGVMAQAIGRCWRLGQTRPVLATVMVAAGTLDEHKAMVLSRKGKVLDAIAAGPDNAMGVLSQGQGVEERELLARMVRERLARRRPHIGPDRGGNTLVET